MLAPTLEDGDLSRKRFEGIRPLLASLDITTIDLLDTFDGIPKVESLRINPLDVQPNARGHVMILENLYAKLHFPGPLSMRGSAYPIRKTPALATRSTKGISPTCR